MKKSFLRDVLVKNVGNQGFTLVELMTSVMIVGILAAIAIPNYRTYQSKARQSEAKIKLGTVFTAESTFAVDRNTFTCCLISIGAGSATAGANSYYAYGFGTCAAPGNVFSGAATCLATDGFTPAQQKTFGSAVVPTAAALAGSTVTAVPAFTAVAAGNISSTSAGYDTWQITEANALTNTLPNL